MVEASQVDWACHANDPAHLLSDLLMYDRAVAAALDFARRDRKTLVLALSDHNTGGMSIGNYATSNTYSHMKLGLLIDPLKRMQLSARAMWEKLGNDRTPERVKVVVEESWGLHPTGEQASRILAIAESDRDAPEKAFGEVLCPAYTAIGWTTHGHTGGDVPLHAFGPGRPSGLVDGPDIGRTCAKALGLDLDKLNSRLFVEADKPFKAGKVFLDRTDNRNPVVKVESKGKTAALPVNKNLVSVGNVVSELEGVVVYAPDTDKVYLPLQAVYIIKGTTKGLPHVALSLPAGAGP
jgi:alkaline phosphatase